MVKSGRKEDMLLAGIAEQRHGGGKPWNVWTRGNQNLARGMGAGGEGAMATRALPTKSDTRKSVSFLSLETHNSFGRQTQFSPVYREGSWGLGSWSNFIEARQLLSDSRI